jgi:hypothetical protein
MMTYFLLTLTWFAIVFLPPLLAYRRPVSGHMRYSDNSVDAASDTGTAL